MRTKRAGFVPGSISPRVPSLWPLRPLQSTPCFVLGAPWAGHSISFCFHVDGGVLTLFRRTWRGAGGMTGLRYYCLAAAALPVAHGRSRRVLQSLLRGLAIFACPLRVHPGAIAHEYGPIWEPLRVRPRSDRPRVRSGLGDSTGPTVSERPRVRFDFVAAGPATIGPGASAQEYGPIS